MTNRQDAMEAAMARLDEDFNMDARTVAIAEAAIAAYLAAREAEGFVMVPVEPTQAMIDAGWRHAGFPAVQGYRAMLAACSTNGDR